MTFNVLNKGPYDADEVVQVYMSWLDIQSPKVPKVTLVGFQRPHLLVGKSMSMSFTVTGEQMSVWNNTSLTVIPGEMVIHAGGQQPGQRTQVLSNVLSATFTLKG